MILDDLPPGPLSALALIVRRWRFVLACMVVAIGAAWAYGATRPQPYEAAALLTTMGSPRQAPTIPGLPAGLLGNVAASGGMQATPQFLARMAKLPSILRAVGLAPMNPARGDQRIVERLLGRPVADTTDPAIPSLVSTAVRVGLDEPTGLITVSAASPDSALARRLVQSTIQAVSRAFTEATQTQAGVVRVAQAQRVDSASRQLRSAEGALRAFLSTNRVIAPYSAGAVQQARFQRELDLAQSVYNQSIAERQAVIARELDETPALVVLDPVAPQLSLRPRKTSLYIALALVLSFLFACTWTLTQGALARSARGVAVPPGAAGETPLQTPVAHRP